METVFLCAVGPVCRVLRWGLEDRGRRGCPRRRRGGRPIRRWACS